MKKTYLPFVFLFLCSSVKAQVFNGPGGAILNNGGQETYFSLSVAGLNPAAIDSTFGLTGVCIDITHPAVSELKVTLMSPSGIEVQLNGVLSCTNGSNFTGTCFEQSNPNSVTTAQSPYTGTFRPVGNLGRFNAGKPGNGVWKLIVKDFVAGANSGNVVSWSVTFGSNPPKPVVLHSSNLPLVFINTTKALSEDEQIVSFAIVDNGTARNNFSDPRNHFNGKADVHVRGSSSKMFEKPSLKVELRDASGANDLEAPLLGMPAESDWVLTASYNDKTLMRNALSQHLYRKMGRYSPRTRFVEVIINGEYFGVYTFMEQPKRGKERVPVAKMTPMDNQFPYVTGGYIVQINRNDDPGWYSLHPGVSNNGAKFYYQFNYPRAEDITDPQKNYIKAVIDTFENVMASPSFADPAKGFRRYVLEHTFLDYLIINELSKNADAYKLCTYMYKDNLLDGNRLSVGPAWDFDIAWHNCNFGNSFSELYWQFEQPNNEYPIPTWWKSMMTDKSFQDQLYCRYHTLRMEILKDETIFAYIDEQAALLSEAQQRNFRQFPVMGAYIYPNPQPQQGATYQGELEDLKAWVNKRGDWLDTHVPGFCADVAAGEVTPARGFPEAFPNPFDGSFTIDLSSVRSGSGVQLKLVDLAGAEACSQWYFPGETSSSSVELNTAHLSPGVYILHVLTDGVSLHSKVLKAAQ